MRRPGHRISHAPELRRVFPAVSRETAATNRLTRESVLSTFAPMKRWALVRLVNSVVVID